MPPSVVPTYTYTEEGDIVDILSQHGVDLTLDDDGDGTASEDTEQGSLTKAIYWATARVNLYCLAIYKASELAKSWMVNYWASVLAARQLCGRRGNPVPGSLEEDYKATLEDLELIAAKKALLPEIATRSPSWPAWSNLRVNPYRRIKKARVETQISERTAADYPRNTDLGAQRIQEP